MGSDCLFHLPETGRNWLFPYTRCWDWPKAPFILCNHHRPSMMLVLLSIFKRLRKQGPKWFSSFLLSTVAQSLHLVSLSCVIPLYLERWMLVVGFYPEPFQHAPKSVLKSRVIMECYNSLSLIFLLYSFTNLLIWERGTFHSTLCRGHRTTSMTLGLDSPSTMWVLRNPVSQTRWQIPPPAEPPHWAENFSL